MSDTDETQQRLKAALHYTVGCMCQRLTEQHHREFSRQLVAAIAEATYRQCGQYMDGHINAEACAQLYATRDVFAKDLEAFARHAKRSTVSTEDVKLLARRSSALFVHIQNKSEELTEEQRGVKKSTGKKKSKDIEKSKE